MSLRRIQDLMYVVDGVGGKVTKNTEGNRVRLTVNIRSGRQLHTFPLNNDIDRYQTDLETALNRIDELALELKARP